MKRWTRATAVAAVVLVAAAGCVGSRRTADAACTADPPGIDIPDHVSRGVQLRPTGWYCVLADGGEPVADVPLGWWPDDPRAVWAESFDPEQAQHQD